MNRKMLCIVLVLNVLVLTVLPLVASADTTLGYRSEGDCSGDFDQLQLKESWLRADSRQGDGDSSMIYDGAEKLGYFLDHRAHTFMQIEMDEDAADLQKDIMGSLRKNVRNKTGFDPFALAQTLCPGAASGARGDQLPGEPVDCGNGVATGVAPGAAGGKPLSQEQLAAAMNNGQMGGGDGDSQQLVQRMLQQQMAEMSPEQQAALQQMMAKGGSVAMPMPPSSGGQAAAAPVQRERIDRDAGETRVEGIACMRRQHLRGEEMLREDCYAPATALQLGEKEMRRLSRFGKSLQQWGDSLSPLAGTDTREPADDRVLIQRICYRAGDESGRATLTIDRAAIADTRFEVPAGYAPLDLNAGSEQTPGNRE